MVTSQKFNMTARKRFLFERMDVTVQNIFIEIMMHCTYYRSRIVLQNIIAIVIVYENILCALYHCTKRGFVPAIEMLLKHSLVFLQ